MTVVLYKVLIPIYKGEVYDLVTKGNVHSDKITKINRKYIFTLLNNDSG